MTESVAMMFTDSMPKTGTITGINVTTLGTISPLLDTATQQLTTSKEDTATSGELTAKHKTTQ